MFCSMEMYTICCCSVSQFSFIRKGYQFAKQRDIRTKKNFPCFHSLRHWRETVEKSWLQKPVSHLKRWKHSSKNSWRGNSIFRVKRFFLSTIFPVGHVGMWFINFYYFISSFSYFHFTVLEFLLVIRILERIRGFLVFCLQDYLNYSSITSGLLLEYFSKILQHYNKKKSQRLIYKWIINA